MGKKYNNLISTTAGFKYNAQQPLDDRAVVEKYEDLAELVSSNVSYEGMEVFVTESKKTYVLVNNAWEAVATEAFVTTKIAEAKLEGEDVDLSGYATKAELPTKVSQLENDSKFITREEVPEVDLSEYAKKSEIPDVSDFISEIPAEYVTELELDAKGYLTEHQSLDGYATEAFVTNKIAEAELNEKEVDLSGYATKDDIKDFIKEVPSEYITETELNAKGYLTEQSLDGLATESYVDEAIPEIDDTLSISGASADSRAVGILLSAINQRLDNLNNIESGLDSTDDGEGNVVMQFLYTPLSVADDDLGNVYITL